MCACRLEERTAPRYEIEDFIFEMESRPGNGAFDTVTSPTSGTDSEDIYSQLAQKEKDLILAAELGKALLEKNEELVRVNDKLHEDFTAKLERLEQEKHALRRKLDAAEGEYESRVLELQGDLQQLKKELDDQTTTSKFSDRERASFIHELAQQNQRLTTQLKQVSQSEEQLGSQLQQLREQFNSRRSNLHDHALQLEMHREEITIITEKKAELERRIQHLIEERDSIAMTLEESTDRIIVLEKHTKEQEIKLRLQERDLEELRQTNTQLQDKVEILTRRSSTPASLIHANTSLLNEIEMSEDEGRHSLSCSNTTGRSLPQSQSSSGLGFPTIEDEDEEIECDDSELSSPVRGVHIPATEELASLKKEVLDAYNLVRNLCEQMRHRGRHPSSSVVSTSSEEMALSDVRVGMLSDVLRDLRGLLHDILRKESKGVCSTCGRNPAEKELLEREANISKEELVKTQRKLAEKTEDLKKRTDEVIKLTSELNITQAELSAVREERNLLKSDLSNTELSKDEVVSKAWEARDQAIARKNTLEVDLAKSRIDVMSTNSQLMEAIQQKLELSQQLEQWQVDMQSLLEQQVSKRLREVEKTEKNRSADDSDCSTSGAPSLRGKQLLAKLWRS